MEKNGIAFKSFFFFLVLFWLPVFAWGHTDVTPEQAKQMIDTNNELIVIDVRELSEYCSYGHIPGALNYPWNSAVLQARYTELPVNAEILAVCGVGGRSNNAANFLDSHGFIHIYDMLGGMSAWTYDTVGCVDTDYDGINDDLDNCPANPNSNQADRDGDGLGDVCDPDNDNDGICDPGKTDPSCTGSDNCQYINNPCQCDADGDGMGDACDTCTDTDHDGYGDPGFPVNTCPVDNCPDLASPNQADADGDCIGDVCDPEPEVYDPLTLDSYPPQGNSIGDACDCEGNFNCDGDVDGTDASTFKADFGRNTILHPCIAGDSCNGDFSCDGDVDGTDASIFKQDFGRSQFQNPCPACVVGEWCNY